MPATKTIKQEVTFKATPHAVYEALMDSKQHAAFTGSPAKISSKVNGAFTAYGDYISGKNLELVKDKKIVQSWRSSDWEKGVESTVTYVLKPMKGTTKLTFTHAGVPADDAKSIASGWKDFYWKPLKEFLG